MLIARLSTFGFALLFGASATLARDYYLTPEGAGARDGASWENAFGSERLRSVFEETVQPGDRLLLGSGIYRAVSLVISRGGEAGQSKEMVGVDRGQGLPHFLGNWSVEHPAKGATAFRLEPGVSHVALRGIRIQGYAFGVHAPATPDGAARTHLRFEDLRLEQMRYGLYLSDCDDVRLRDCVVRSYTKHGFRFEQGCDRVTIKQCLADCSEGDPVWETKTELLPFGYFLNDAGRPNTAFVFQDCEARNHMMPLQTNQYKNGDGFVVEGNTSDVRFARCRSLRNQDGGFDLKASDVRLADCVATGNARGFRIWSSATLDNCFAGWGAVGLWNNGGPVQARRCTFHELKDAAVLTDDAARGEVILADCLITATAAAYRNTGRGTVALPGTVITAGPGDAGFSKPAKEWDGLGNAMDSETYPDKGYRASLRSDAPR